MLNVFTPVQQQVFRLKESTTLSVSLFHLSYENVIRVSSTSPWRFLHPMKFPIYLWLTFGEICTASAYRCFLWTTSTGDKERNLS